MKIYRFSKRVLDIVLALVALVVFAPLFLILAILVKRDSDGPVIFRHKVMGKGGVEFEMYKFRTMVPEADELLKDPELWEEYCKEGFKLRNDCRVTKIGKFLRKYSLDELPQLVNILKGEMSWVGPRPYTKRIVEEIVSCDEDMDALVFEVQKLKPGLTCFWQVEGRSEIQVPELKLMLDVKYLWKKSFWVDIWLIVRTIPAVIRSKGAW
jgi:lipopolysaccharide/colanic/teichoic acid biosynthesis glycosyltransferase